VLILLVRNLSGERPTTPQEVGKKESKILEAKENSWMKTADNKKLALVARNTRSQRTGNAASAKKKSG